MREENNKFENHVFQTGYSFMLLDELNICNLFQVMTRYISNPDNLKLMMNMLKEKSRNIQFEAFHVFKVCQYFCL